VACGLVEFGKEATEFGGAMDNAGDSAVARPFGEPGLLERGRGFAGAFEFDFDVAAVEEEVEVGVAGDGEGGAVAFAGEEAVGFEDAEAGGLEGFFAGRGGFLAL